MVVLITMAFAGYMHQVALLLAWSFMPTEGFTATTVVKMQTLSSQDVRMAVDASGAEHRVVDASSEDTKAAHSRLDKEIDPHLAIPVRSRLAMSVKTHQVSTGVGEQWRPPGNEHLHLKNSSSFDDATSSARGSSQTAKKICMHGKVVPSLYIIGAQHAATTNFADAISSSAGIAAGPHLAGSGQASRRKALAIFNDEKKMRTLGKTGWLDLWPGCDEPVQFTMDATPNYLASVDAPGNMASWYGPHFSQITVVVLLREPLSRLHANFRHLRRLDQTRESFTSYVRRAMANSQSGCLSGVEYSNENSLTKCSNPDRMPHGDPLRLSLYAPELQNWLRYLPARNFVIVPWKQYLTPLANETSTVSYIIRDRVRGTLQGDGTHSKYPKPTKTPFKKDMAKLDPKDRQKLGSLVSNLGGAHAMAKVLAPELKHGLTLFGYKGATDDMDAVAKFLEEHW